MLRKQNHYRQSFMTFIITKMKILQLVILCLSGKVVFGYGSGAPSNSKACNHMVPGHVDTVPIPRKDLSRTPYEVKAEIDGSYVRLSVSGLVSVAGFLIQARLTSNSPAIGEFKLQSQSNNSIARYQTCGKEVIISRSCYIYNNNILVNDL